MLPSDIPDLEVHIAQVDGRDILPYRRDRLLSSGRGRGEVKRFDGGKEGRLAGIVEAKEKDGILCRSVKDREVILVSWVQASGTFPARSIQIN